MNTFTVESCPYPADDTAVRLIRHQCVDYTEASRAFGDAVLESEGGAVELVRHWPGGSVKIKAIYRRNPCT